jgi:hypothetical protein
MNAIDDDEPVARGQRFEIRLPGRRLRCQCGHWLSGYDFSVFEDEHHVRAVCSQCHETLFELETGWRHG